ncbi:hypothetical protein N9W61_01980 [Algibacter sp.]|nr:hypothetical protein [Algibacter sp.]
MNKIIIKSLMLSLPIIVFGIILEILVRNTPNDYSVKKAYLDKHSTDIETLILGSSESTFGIDPKYFSSNTYNASYFNQDLQYDLLILNKYINKLTKLKTIILPITYLTYFNNLSTSKEKEYVKNYELYFDLRTGNTNQFNYHNEVLNSSFLKNSWHAFRYYVLKDSISKLMCSDLGWCNTWEGKESFDLDIFGPTEAENHNSLIKENKELISENLSYLTSIINICRENNIKLILFTQPTYKTYFNNIDKNSYARTIDQTIEISKSYENCVFLNYTNSIDFNAKDYLDPVHFNDSGAKILSLKLNQVIE